MLVTTPVKACAIIVTAVANSMHSSRPKPPEPSFRAKAVDFARSPVLVLMLLAGLVLVLGVPYLALRTLPGINNPITGEPPAPTGNPNLGIDFQELEGLPPELAGGAKVILSQEEPQTPEPLKDLPEPDGSGLTYPVSESVESTRPTLTWTNFAPGPFKLELADRANKPVVTSAAVQITNFVVPKDLVRGATYTWRVTAANGESQAASFIVLTEEQVGDWQGVRLQFKESHLVLGTVAEQLGMLSRAEREYQEFSKAFPQAEAPARLLANVLALRE
ncbi:MAG: hypothetical protein ABI995_01285 [Acidobacteriota bacterium]